MTYNKKRTLVFIETKLFTQLVKEYLSDDEYRELQQYIMKNPEVGKIIRGSGGVRKVRWAREGMGKSGGIRTIYYWAKARDQVYMLTMYSKSEKENIDKKTLAQITKELESMK
ncbi:MAG TPA: type II toxin-antitoxin system RelE/ParE family toxin [Gammaproteobacteria bacterium]|nr:type II toxin-antitoxin system RelE/ParE family toxin [Gammaproteobacteria bacterium]